MEPSTPPNPHELTLPGHVLLGTLICVSLYALIDVVLQALLYVYQRYQILLYPLLRHFAKRGRNTSTPQHSRVLHLLLPLA